MTDDHDPDGGADEPPDEDDYFGGRAPTEDEEGSDDHWLSSLLSALESLERRGSTSGRRSTDRTVFDYDVSVRSGDDVLNGDSRFEGSPFADEGSSDRRPGRSRDRPRTRRRSPTSGSHLTTRRYEDELLVTADVSGTDPDDVTVGFDDSALVVAVSGRELDRVEVPWPDRTAEATIKNGVLTVWIEPGGDDD